MTRVMVKTLFGSYIGQSIQLYYSGRSATPMLIVKRPDGSHRTVRVVDVIDLGPDPVPQSPVAFTPVPKTGEVHDGQTG